MINRSAAATEAFSSGIRQRGMHERKFLVGEPPPIRGDIDGHHGGGERADQPNLLHVVLGQCDTCAVLLILAIPSQPSVQRRARYSQRLGSLSHTAMGGRHRR